MIEIDIFYKKWELIAVVRNFQHSYFAHMMLIGHEKSLTLTFFYPEFEGQKTSPQVYVIRRQQELNDLCRQIRNRLRRGRGKGLTRKQMVQKLTQ